MDELLTTAQAARELGLSSARVRQYIALGRLRAIKPGQDYLLTRAEIANFIRNPPGRPRPGPQETTEAPSS